jgi:hypothetical protein
MYIYNVHACKFFIIKVYFPNLDWMGHENFFLRLDGLWNFYLHHKMGPPNLLAKFVIYLQPTLAVTLWPVPKGFFRSELNY